MTRPPVGSTGTPDDLQVEPGDVVRFHTGHEYRITQTCDGIDVDFSAERVRKGEVGQGVTISNAQEEFTLISRANPDQPALKIEAGKYYRTSGGHRVGPMKPSGHPKWPWIVVEGDGNSWRNDGSEIGYTGFGDLIAEWHGDQPAHIITHEGRTYDLTALETPFGLLPNPVREALQAWPHGLEIYNCDETGRVGAWVNVGFRFYDWHTVRAKPAPAEIRIQCYRGGRGVNYEYGTCIKNPDGSIDWASWKDAE